MITTNFPDDPLYFPKSLAPFAKDRLIFCVFQSRRRFGLIKSTVQEPDPEPNTNLTGASAAYKIIRLRNTNLFSLISLVNFENEMAADTFNKI
jgi:hypothetical protein